MKHALESFMNSMRYDRIFKILISACKQCLPPLFTLFVLDCLVMFNTYCVVFNLIKIRSIHTCSLFSIVFFLVARVQARGDQIKTDRKQGASVHRSNFNQIVLCFFALFGFVLCTPMLSVSQDCQFLIAPSIFSNVYLTLQYQV